MLATLTLGFVLALDNLHASASLGTMTLRLGDRQRLATAFALFEGGMVLLGGLAASFWMVWSSVSSEKFAIAALLVAGALVVLGSANAGRAAKVTSSRWFHMGLPLSLSFDNLAGGAGLAALNSPMLQSLLIAALTSAVVTGGGVYLGLLTRRVLGARITLVAGSSLILMALHLALMG